MTVDRCDAVVEVLKLDLQVDTTLNIGDGKIFFQFLVGEAALKLLASFEYSPFSKRLLLGTLQLCK